MPHESHIRTYDPEKCAVFLKTRERFGGLSNMSAGFPLCVNGIDIRTSEALYQACRFPLRPDVQQLIIDEKSPMTAKMRSKPYRDDTRGDWESVRVRVMRWSLRVKLAQNWEKFGDLLLSSGDMPIVEKKSRQKDFWGAVADDNGMLIGMNVLGRLLMELREELKDERNTYLRVVQPLKLKNFLLFSSKIEVVGERKIKVYGVDVDSGRFI